MNEFEIWAIEEAVKSQIGKTAKYYIYDRSIFSPMSFLLAEAEAQINKKFIVYWVDEGFPENFCLTGFEQTPVVFNSRYLETTAFIRQLILGNTSSSIRIELSERICLRLIAELALRYNNEDFATFAFIKSILGQNYHIRTTDILLDLEYERKNEAYMATWFFGLTHEIGHLLTDEKIITTGWFSDETIEKLLGNAFEICSFPAEIKQKLKDSAKNNSVSGRLGIDNLRREILSDTFAATVLFKTTVEVMQKSNEKFRIENYIFEMIICLNLVAIIERCKFTAKITTGSQSIRELALNDLAGTISYMVRVSFLKAVLMNSFIFYYSQDGTSADELEKAFNNIYDSIAKTYQPILDEVESGMAKAMRFACFPQERETDLLVKFVKELLTPEGAITSLETNKFCKLADTLGVSGEMIEELQKNLENSAETIDSNKHNETFVYIILYCSQLRQNE